MLHVVHLTWEAVGRSDHRKYRSQHEQLRSEKLKGGGTRSTPWRLDCVSEDGRGWGGGGDQVCRGRFCEEKRKVEDPETRNSFGPSGHAEE